MKNRPVSYVAIVLGILVALLLLWGMVSMGQWQQAQKRLLAEQSEQQKELNRSIRESTQLQLMSQLLDRLDRELSQSPARTLSTESIHQLAILSRSFAPEGYDYLTTPEEYNVARGQLLLNLLQMRIDSVSFAAIMESCTFAGADLREADLRRMNLSNIDLHAAMLENARLDGAVLDGADLKGARLWGASLSQASLANAQMNRIDLRWANLNEAKLPGAEMPGASLDNAQLRDANLSCVILYYAKARDAFFEGAILERCNMFGSDISRSNFDGADMNLFDVRVGVAAEASFEGANMWECKLRELSVEDGAFLEKLEAQQVKGARDVQSRYELIRDRTKRSSYQVRIVP